MIAFATNICGRLMSDRPKSTSGLLTSCSAHSLLVPDESLRPKSAFDLENVYAASIREFLVKRVLEKYLQRIVIRTAAAAELIDRAVIPERPELVDRIRIGGKGGRNTILRQDRIDIVIGQLIASTVTDISDLENGILPQLLIDQDVELP